MRAIFISYRRDDTEGQAGRLFQDLSATFGSETVFMDVSGIEPGIDFRRAIEKQTESCGVLLALIGRNWLTITNPDGKRRLDDSNDVVRFETASALRRDIPVIPVLVQGARMPRAEDLPDDLKDLSFRNSVEITHARWDSDMQLLIKALHPHVQRAVPAQTEGAHRSAAAPEVPSYPPLPSAPQSAPQRVRKWAAPLIALAALLVLGGGWMIYDRLQENERQLAKAVAEQRAVAEKAAAEQAAAQKAATERAATEQAKAAANKAAAEEAAAKRAAAGRASNEQAEAARNAVAEKAAAQRASGATADADRLNAPAKPSSRDKVAAHLNISGRWRDNWGTVFTITQDGNAIRVAAEGNSCRGGYFRSTGSGTVTGNSFETTYQSTLPSRGECFGTVSSSGMRMTSTCRDTVCGQFASSVDRL